MSTASDEDLVLVFNPPLVALLVAAERSKGNPLTEEEVLDIRDAATCIRLRSSTADLMADERGYDDLDPERCWDEWESVRARFNS